MGGDSYGPYHLARFHSSCGHSRKVGFRWWRLMIIFFPVMARIVFGAAFLSALLISSAALVAAEYYRWVDHNGVVHFTDNLHNIPEIQRGNVGRIQSIEPPRVPPPPPPLPPTEPCI